MSPEIAPLSVRHISVVRRLIAIGHQHPDMLFIAADAYREFARELDLLGIRVAAGEALLLADRLVAAAQRQTLAQDDPSARESTLEPLRRSS